MRSCSRVRLVRLALPCRTVTARCHRMPMHGPRAGNIQPSALLVRFPGWSRPHAPVASALGEEREATVAVGVVGSAPRLRAQLLRAAVRMAATDGGKGLARFDNWGTKQEAIDRPPTRCSRLVSASEVAIRGAPPGEGSGVGRAGHLFEAIQMRADVAGTRAAIRPGCVLAGRETEIPGDWSPAIGGPVHAVHVVKPARGAINEGVRPGGGIVPDPDPRLRHILRNRIQAMPISQLRAT
jgi:hypothetical protein